MDSKPDYSSYNYNQLVDVYNSIDREQYPDRFREVERRLKELKIQQDNEANAKKFTYQENIDAFEFRGNTKEFFSIWIVNVFLTIVTLGIYSAWAKVRTTTYFYSNTILDNSSFRYHAEPMQILRGRLIAVVLFVSYYVSGYISSTALLITAGVLGIFMPMFFVMSMAFKMRVSSYRNVRFTFEKDFKKAYLIFAAPIVAVVIVLFFNIQAQEEIAASGDINVGSASLLTFFPFLIFFLYPVFEYFLLKFRVNQSGYGTERFSFAAKIRSLYGIYVPAIVLFFILMMVTMFLIGSVGAFFAGSGESTNAQYLLWLAMLPVMLIYLAFFAFIQTKRTNLVYNSTSIAGHQIKSELSVTDMFVLYLTNTLGIMVSLGLLVPWAMIRTTKYKLSKITIMSEDSISNFVATQVEDQSALGEEVGELFDLGIGV